MVMKRFNIRKSLEELVSDASAAGVLPETPPETPPEVIVSGEPVLENPPVVDLPAGTPPVEVPPAEVVPPTVAEAIPPVEVLLDIEQRPLEETPVQVFVEGTADAEFTVEEQPGVVEAQPTEDAPEFGTVEFIQNQAEDDALVENYAGALNEAAALESYIETIGRSKDRGGLSMAGASMVMESVSSIALRVGHPSPFSNMSAQESFSTVSQRQRNTQVAMEAVEGVLGRVLGSVVKAISQFAARVKRFLNSFIFSMRTLQGQINATYKALNSEAFLNPNARFTNSKAVSVLSIDGKFDINKSLEFSAKVAASLPHGIIRKMHEIEAFVRTVANSKLQIEELKKLKTPGFIPGEYMPVAFKVTKDPAGFYATYENSLPLPSGLSMTLVCPLSNNAGSESSYTSGSSSSMISIDRNGQAGSSAEFVSRDRVKVLLDKCQTILKNMYAVSNMLDDSYMRIEAIANSVTKIQPLFAGGTVAGQLANRVNESIQKRQYRVAIGLVSGVMQNYHTLVLTPVTRLTVASFDILSSSVKYLYQNSK